MKKLFRFLIGGLCIAAGIAGAAFTIYLFTQGVDTITGVIYISLIIASLSIIGLGGVIVTGRSVKKALHDVISGITF